MSPDVLLSRLGLRYGGGADLQGTPAKIVDNLIKLTEAYDAGTVEFVSQPITAATFNPSNVAKETALLNDYRDALASGSLSKVHAIVAKINKLLVVKGGNMVGAFSDFEIVAHQQTPLGDAARWIVNYAVEHENTVDDFFDQYGAAIRKYAKAAK